MYRDQTVWSQKDAGRIIAKWAFTIPTWTPIAVADTVANTNAGYQTLQGGNATQTINLIEVYMGGQAGASSPSIMMVARDSTFAGTPGALAAPNGLTPLNPSTAALAAPPLGIISGTTNPQRSSTSKLLNLSYNAFGGIVRWVAAPGEELGILGNVTLFGELTLSAFTGGTPGLTGSHLIFEPF